MNAQMRPPTRTAPVWISVVVALIAASCASQQTHVEGLIAGEEPPISAERAAVIEDIRRKAEESRQADTGSEADVSEPVEPPAQERRTYSEIRAIEAELDALADAARRSSDPGEIAALRREAARLEELRKQVELDGEGGSGSISQ